MDKDEEESDEQDESISEEDTNMSSGQVTFDEDMEYQIDEPESPESKSNDEIQTAEAMPRDFSTRWTAIPGEEASGFSVQEREVEEEEEVHEAEEEGDDALADNSEPHVNDHAYADPGEVVEIQAPPEEIR